MKALRFTRDLLLGALALACVGSFATGVALAPLVLARL